MRPKRFAQVRPILRLLPTLACLVSSALLGTPAQALDRPILVELFTSQGCSSCPPAEELLVELARNRRDVLALGFHVDYWDRLGWKDPFSSPAATARQRSYSRTLGTDQVYTPQMVVEGRIDVLGSDSAAAATAIGKSAAETGPRIPMKLIRRGEGFSASIGSGAGDARVLLVGYDSLHETAVRRGENAGRTVSQANVVRSVQPLGEWRGRDVEFTGPVPAGEKAVLILQAKDGRILGLALAGG